MEAILIVEGIGGWKSFVEIEESLTLDELLFLHKYLMKNKHNHYKRKSLQQSGLGRLRSRQLLIVA
jgi:hypothetical protein